MEHSVSVINKINICIQTYQLHVRMDWEGNRKKQCIIQIPTHTASVLLYTSHILRLRANGKERQCLCEVIHTITQTQWTFFTTHSLSKNENGLCRE